MGGSTHAHRPGRTDQALPLGCPPPGAFRPAGLSGSSPASGPPKPGCPVRCRPPRRPRRGCGRPARAQPRRGRRQGPAGNLPPLAVSAAAAGGQPTARTETTKEWHQGIDHERHDDRTTKYRESTTKDTKYTKKDNELTPARNHRSRCRIEPAASSLVRSADLHLFRVFRVFRGSFLIVVGPIPSGGYWFPAPVVPSPCPGDVTPGRVSQVPRRSVDARHPLSPRRTRLLHLLVASQPASGFTHSGRLAIPHWCNEAETG